jgi:hypothetical protein
MNEKQKKVTFTLTPAEFDKLDTRAHKAKLSKTAYFRQMLKGLAPKDAPSPDFKLMVGVLGDINNNMSQIAKIASSTGNVNADVYMQEVSNLDAALYDIRLEMTAPGRMWD